MLQNPWNICLRYILIKNSNQIMDRKPSLSMFGEFSHVFSSISSTFWGLGLVKKELKSGPQDRGPRDG